MQPILSGFRRLGQFSGRDSRAIFWPYAGLVLGVGVLAIIVVIMAWMPSFIAETQAFATQHPDRVTTQVGPGSYTVTITPGDPPFLPDNRGVMLGISLVVVALVVLLAAAVTRRLHDTGRSGLWGLPTPIFLLISLTLMPGLMSSFVGPDPDMRLFGLLFANNAAYILSLGLLLLFLVLPGRPGPNRFGPQMS